MRRTRILVVGVGALGSHLVQALRNEDVSIRVVDFDRVEMKNVASQFHLKGSVGKKKVDALRRTMHFCYGRAIETIGNKLTIENSDEVMGDEVDLIVDCLDNGWSRGVVQGYAIANKIPCVHGALAANGEFGRVVWTQDFTIDNDSTGAPTCEDGEFLPFIQIVSARLAQSVQQFLSDNKQVGYSISRSGTERL